MRNKLLLLVALILAMCSAMAQAPDLEPDSKGSPVPIISFSLERPGVEPSHYAIAVESTGRAAYRAVEIAEKGQTPGDPYMLQFKMSEATTKRIFDLARQTDYFRGNFDYSKSRIANTGAKTLTYMQGHLPNDFEHPTDGHIVQTTYNWSENPAIQELTNIFQGISLTLELGRRLDFARRFDKLGLDSQLKQLEEAQKDKQAEEVQAIAPVLRNIANDFSVMHIARQRAQRILAAAGQK